MNGAKLHRRSFVKQQAATMAAAAATQAAVLRFAHAGGSDTLRVGLVGCGGRGSGAAAEALTADPGTRLVAMADVFSDQIASSLQNLTQQHPTSVDVPPERQFVGFDAYQKVIDQVDVVILASTPHFRPQHLAYAVEKGVHVFAEKPVATDAAGVRKCLEACYAAKEKNLSIVSGLCWRYHHPRRASIAQVFEGAIGDIVAIETVYNSTGVWDPRRTREQCASEMEYQLRNWYYYTWLSGDHICEQAVHGLDTMAWVMHERPPIQCWGTGGRQVRTAPRFGNIYDHFAIVYEYPNRVRGYHSCRHWHATAVKVQDQVLGTKGACDVFGHRITGEKKWKYSGESNNMYQTEHDELFASIRAGTPINNGDYMCHSTMLAIMGRMAAYTGSVITWEMAMNSQEDLSPPHYEWGDVPMRPIARPGETKFI